MNDFLKIDDLWKLFGSFVALREISLEVKEGEFICFLGPSGCGKTTLLRAIAGLDIQTKGSIFQAGKDISNLPPAERDFGIVFQSYALFPNLTIGENISFGLENEGVAKNTITERVTELLDLVGLPEQIDKYPAQLSGGQQQRIALARAIASSPGLLLLDEPLSALDAKVRVFLRHEMKKLQRKLGVTTIMVTHDQEEALALADRIMVMDQGIIKQVGTPTDIYNKPDSLFVADFIGEMNQVTSKMNDDGTVQLFGQAFKCVEHDAKAGDDVVATIRPEDIFVVDKDATVEQSLVVKVKEMEFLGSFWRCILAVDNGVVGKEAELMADYSINAVQRCNIETGGNLQIELPQDRLQVFSAAQG